MTTVRQRPRNRPDGYPSQLERELVLPGGERLWVRPIVPEDAPVLAAELAAADDDTVYQRFFTPRFKLTEDRLRYLTEIDYSHHLALVAMTADGDNATGLAVARYVERTPADVEAAIVVKPEFRKRGLARALLDMLAELARNAGYETMTASYLAENDAAGRLLASGGYSSPVVDEITGVVEVTKTLDGG